MFVDIKVAAGGFTDDLTVERVASYQKATNATREDCHMIIDQMFDVVEKKAHELQGSKS